MAELIAQLQPSVERTSLEPSHLGLDFVFTVRADQPNAEWIRWAVTSALAPGRAIVRTTATPVATAVAIRLVTSIRTAEETQRIASILAPALIMLALPRPDQELWLGGDSFELRLTMPYQDDLEYLVEMAAAILGMIDSVAAESGTQGLPTFDDLVSSSQRGVSLIAPGPDYPLAITGRQALLTARKGGSEIGLAAGRVLRDLFSLAEAGIAQLTEEPDLDRLRQRIAGTRSLLVDHWLQAGSPPGYGSPFSSPPRSYDYESSFVSSPPSGYTGGNLSGPASRIYPYSSPSQSPPPSYGQYQSPPSSYGQYQSPPSGYGQYQSPPSSYGQYQSPPSSYGQYQSPPPGYGQYQSPPSTPVHSEPGRDARDKESRLAVTTRRVSAVVVGLLLAGYVSAVLAGWIPDKNKLGLTELGTVVVGLAAVLVLLQPRVLTRISEVSLGGVKLQLRDIEEKQAAQSEELRLSRFALFLALPKDDRDLLRGLQNDLPVGRPGTGDARNELRRLADLGLIKRRPGRAISDLKDGWFDIRDFVELTDRGRRYLQDITNEGID